MTDRAKKTLAPLAAAALVSPDFHMDGDWRGESASLTVGGVIGVGRYSETEIILLTSGERISVIGSNMCVSVLERGNIVINGKIENISVSLGRKRVKR